jgi:hypothetical protein
MANTESVGDKLDKLVTGISSIAARLDAVEEKEKAKSDGMSEFMDSFKKRMDAAEEERRADRARLDEMCGKVDAMAKKDGEESEEEKKKKADAAEAEEKAKKDAAEAEEKAKKDAAGVNADLLARLAEIDKRLPASLPENERQAFVVEQARAERVHQMFGDAAGAPHWHNGETRQQYLARLASKFKAHSRDWKDIDLNALPEAALAVAATRIYADAMEAARHPTDLPAGTLRMLTEKDQAGRAIHKFVGSEDAAWKMFSNPDLSVRINTRFDH